MNVLRPYSVPTEPETTTTVAESTTSTVPETTTSTAVPVLPAAVSDDIGVAFAAGVVVFLLVVIVLAVVRRR